MKKMLGDNFGLSELNQRELESTHGGIWPYIVAYVLVEAFLNPSAHIEAFREGWNTI
ncbi:MAG: class IIb bacteriocin, lactobin A/cerein 7B family [Bacteroidales bacterium]|nr:class IIb bacteriocin, lactobin A/cerein 7B family [Bacteroidales bacterium]